MPRRPKHSCCGWRSTMSRSLWLPSGAHKRTSRQSFSKSLKEEPPMATIPSTLSAANSALQPVTEHGWRRGFANLLRNENRQWWGTRKGLIHLLLWLIVLNGLILLVGLPSSRESGDPVPLYTTLIQVFFQVGALATAIGVVTTAQGAIVREKQLGTAAWILSKPVARSAFVLAKFVAYAVGFVGLAIVLPSTIFYGQSVILAGRAPDLAL